MYPMIVRDSSITIVVDGKPHTVLKEHPNFVQLHSALQRKDWASIPQLLEVKSAVAAYVSENCSVENGQIVVTVNGTKHVVQNSLSARILEMMAQGMPFQHMMNCLVRLYSNVSKTAIDEFYDFMEVGNLPITEDGYVLAYKLVRDSYFDVHSNTVKNLPPSLAHTLVPYTTKDGVSVGINPKTRNVVVSMPRFKVDDNRNNECSTGLHFCSYDYLKEFTGDRVMVVKIDPANVVSIPKYHKHTKGRCCEYEIIGELRSIDETVTKNAFTLPVQSNANGVVNEVSSATVVEESSIKKVVRTHDSKGRLLSMSLRAVRHRQDRGTYYM